MGKNKKSLPLYATLFTLLSLAILASLGTWQLQRKAWKEDIIAQLNDAYRAPPTQALDLESDTYSYGKISGTLMADKAILISSRTQNGKVGGHVIVPLRLSNATLLVNMGWTDQPLDTLNLPEQIVTITGLARIPYWSNFTPPNQPAENIWYRLDTQEIANHKQLANAHKRILYAETIKPAISDSLPNNERWYPANNHGQYAAFWFSMAAVLLVIYGLKFIKT